MAKSIGDDDSPLVRQRQTDVYVVLVRTPDRPLLRARADVVELIPGEEHFETLGYHVLKGNEPITAEPLLPGGRLSIGPGAYRAVAVEQSAHQSEPSRPIEVARATTLRVLADAPDDFSWTRDRWLIGTREVPAEAARRAAEAVREIVHVYDGVIHREWYAGGVLVRRHDLGLEGDPIRRTEYQGGRLAVREYSDRDDVLLSREEVDPEGFITAWIRYGADGAETSRWEFDHGMPIREVRGGTEFIKRGDRFGYFKDGKFIDTPRGSISE